MTTRTRSVREWVDRVHERFDGAGLCFGHGTDNARDEAAALVLQTLALPPDCPESEWERPVPPASVARLEGLVERRLRDRVPLAYLGRRAWFAGLPFYVDERVLVPRSPIAELIKEKFRPWVDAGKVHRILDLCTGSGCIGIAAAHAFPRARVDLTDLSDDAIAVAKRNVDEHGLGDRVRVVRSDLFEALDPVSDGNGYDLILSNPPYVGAAEMKSLPPEYGHEPAFALAAGEDGLAILLPLLANAVDYMSEHAVLVVDSGNTDETLAAALPGLPFLWLEFRHGGHGVFLLHKQELMDHADEIARLIGERRVVDGR